MNWDRINPNAAHALHDFESQLELHKVELPADAQFKTEGKKFDAGKPNWFLLPLDIIEEVVKVLTFGASKYGKNNWQELADFEERYFAAALRHLTAWQAGEKMDQESGLHHLSHAMCNLVFLLWKEKRSAG